MPQSKISRPKNTKVSIYNNNNSILLRFSYKQETFNLSLGLPVTPKNLKIAEQKCQQITNDIIFNSFDPLKYGITKREEKKDINVGGISLTSILNFYEECNPNLDSSVIESLTTLRKWINNSPSKFNDPNHLNEFIIYLKNEIPHGNKDTNKKGYSNSYIEVHFKILKSAINLNLKLNKIKTNYQIDILFQTLKTNQKKQIKTYSIQEINLIIKEAYARYSYFIYGAFIEFRFLTGARPSEVTPLTWDDILCIDSKQYILFNKRFTDGILKKGLKQKDEYRLFPINNQLLDLLNKIPKQSNLIFKSVKGKMLNITVFSRKIWKPLILKLVEEKKLNFFISFYDQRHCFGSHVCRQTTDLKTVSYLMGNSPETLQKYYLSVDDNFEVPEI